MLIPTQSRLISSLRALNRKWRSHAEAAGPARREDPLLGRLGETIRHTWHLGVTSFGGPPVHFQIFYTRFVEQEKWVDEQTVHIYLAKDCYSEKLIDAYSTKSCLPYARVFQGRPLQRCYSA